MGKQQRGRREPAQPGGDSRVQETTRVSILRPSPSVLFFVAIFFLVRLPFLLGGYGADTDAYRVALAAKNFWATGEYLPSRLPGYPLHELVTALLIWGGPLLTNVGTAVAALLGVWVFDRIAVAVAVPQRRWLLVAMAFTPWLLINSTVTLDYQWALTAMLGSYLLVIHGAADCGSRSPAGRGAHAITADATQSQGWWSADRSFLGAGALLGVAIGFRITAAAFLFPLVVFILGGAGRHSAGLIAGHLPARATVRVAALVAVSASIVALIAYAPVLRVYGLRFWNFADSRVSPDIVIQLVGQRALGVIGAVAALIALAASWRRLRRFPRLLRDDRHVLLWTLTVIMYTLIFLRLPVDAGYLIPIYPFAFLLVARILVRWALPVIVAASIVAGFVDLDIQRIHNFSPTAAAREVRPSWRAANVAYDLRTRARWRSYAARLAGAPAPPHSVVLTGGAFPDMAVVNWDRLRYAIVERDLGAVSMLSDNGSLWDDDRDVVYLAVSEPRIIDGFRARGYGVYRAEPAGGGWQVHLTAVSR